MTRTLLVGLGEVGNKHLDALECTAGVDLVGVADPAPRGPIPPGVPVFGRWATALKSVAPQFVVVATPPGVALQVARAAAAVGSVVLVEKPVVIDAADLLPLVPGDDRIFVAFQPHFAPGVAGLLACPPHLQRVEVVLSCRRDGPYFRGWRRSRASAGGILHQQAIHGLALAHRLLDAPILTASGEVHHHRLLAEMEDRVTAEIRLDRGRSISVRARIDDDGPPHHQVVLHTTAGQQLVVRGRNLEAGLAAPGNAPTHQQLRVLMYRAVLDTLNPATRPHPSLYSLAALPRLLEVITHVYAAASP